MAKLKLLIDESLDEESDILTFLTSFLKKVETNDEGESKYQEIKLNNYNAAVSNLSRHYNDIIVKITDSMSSRFEDLTASPVFKHLATILDVSSWPNNELAMFGESAILELSDCFEELLIKNGCEIDKLLPEWICLKAHVIPIIKNNQKEFYLKIWQRVFKSDLVKEDCDNILHIIEILLCTPFTNAKLERMFSRMARVKTDYRNRLSRDLLDACLRVEEDGPTLENFNPDPAISLWFEQKVRRLSSSSHRYPEKRKSNVGANATSSSVIDLSALTISDLEDSSDDNM